MSGGSDFHGSKKPNIDIGVGTGILNISKSIIETKKICLLLKIFSLRLKKILMEIK